MLLGEERGRHQYGDLPPGLHRHECGAQRDLRLAEADIAAHDAIHGPIGLQVGDHLLDRLLLVGGLLERKAGRECAVFGVANLEARAMPRGAARVQVEELRRDVPDPLGRLAPRLQPLIACRACAAARSRAPLRCSG